MVTGFIIAAGCIWLAGLIVFFREAKRVEPSLINGQTRVRCFKTKGFGVGSLLFILGIFLLGAGERLVNGQLTSLDDWIAYLVISLFISAVVGILYSALTLWMLIRTGCRIE